MGEFGGSREQKLQEAKRQVELLYTNYGEVGKEHVGIDPELQEGIALLLAMGMQPESSCWGHPERRDDPRAKYAEKNLLPYITFSGYEPNDGLDEHGEAVGYSDEQVRRACARMRTDANLLKSLLDRFYQQSDFPVRMIDVIYVDGMPGVDLVTHDAKDFEDVTRAQQEKIIQASRHHWELFLRFLGDVYHETVRE